MEKQEIIEGNKLIAEFMGSKYYNEPFRREKDDTELTDFWSWSKPENGWPIDLNMEPELPMITKFQCGWFAYHKSFDWLVPVVAKANKLNEEIQKSLNVKYPKTYRNLDDPLGWRAWSYRYISLSTDINYVWDKVLSFIKWYNANAEPAREL